MHTGMYGRKMVGTVLAVTGALLFVLPAYGYSAPSSSLSSNQTITLGQSAVLSYSSSQGSQSITYANISPSVGSVGAPGSGSVTVTPTVTTTYTFTISDGTTSLSKTVTITVLQPPTNTLSASATSIEKGSSVTLSYSSTQGSNAITSASISGVGAVTAPGSGSVVVTPNDTTTYTFTVSDGISSVTKSVTVTVAERTTYGPGTGVTNTDYTFTLGPSYDSQNDRIRYTIDWNGDSTVDEYAPTVGYVASGTAQTVTHKWTSAGTYTIRVAAQDSQSARSLWSTYAITITTAPARALLTASSDVYTSYETPITLTWSSTDATSCTGANFSTGGATSGSVQVVPTQTTTYSVTCTGPGGTGAPSTKTVSYVCTPTNMCSGDDVVNSCTGAVVQSCAYQCGDGACVSPPAPTFDSDFVIVIVDSDGNVVLDGNGNPVTATTNGHIQIRPALVRPNDATQVYWKVSNVLSCTVSGGNGDAWTGITSGTLGKRTQPILQQITYTLMCTGEDGSNVTETATVNVTPSWRER